MWSKLALFVIKNRRILILLLAAMTVFMGWQARKVEMTYDFAQVVSPDDPDMVYFQQFKRTFGEDGNVFVLGMQDSSVYELGNFNELRTLTDTLGKVQGVSGVLSVTRLPRLEKDTATSTFKALPIFRRAPQSQVELDSLMRVVNAQEFYKGQLISPTTGATLLALTLDPKFLNSSKREAVMQEILSHADRFQQKTGIKMHYAGLPYVRATMTTKVAAEMKLFVGLTVVMMAITLFMFFRTWSAVVFPLLIVLVVVVWCVGTMVLMGYKINLLTGLIPSIIIVIGIPNCTYLLSRYHYDYRKSGNQVLAMARVVRKIGLVTLMNNTTTAIGFVVFCFTNIAILFQFGAVATINIFVAFVVSFIMMPIVFTYLPPPTPKQLQHLEAKPLTKLLEFFDYLVLERRQTVYIAALVLIVLATFGVTKVRSVSYMVDDLPKDSSVNSDLKFFEQHFNGVMPLEMVVDTGKKKGILKLKNLEKIDRLEKFLRTQPELTTPVSIVTFLKASTQAFYNGNPDYYRLPDNSEKNYVLSYLARSQSANEGGSSQMMQKLLRSFTDSSGQRARISLKIADVGSHNLDTLLARKIQPEIKQIFNGTGMEVKMTGTTILFTKGNEYLIGMLKESLIIAFGLVGLVVLLLFRSIRAVFFTLLPNFFTLLLTGGIMGYFGIPLKPSTALIFSIALGIDGDNSIHLLAKFRQEMAINGQRVQAAISTTLSEAGTSMIYTSIVLFLGFSVFAFSEFGGTKALGLLMSASLLITNFSNLILLPALLVTFEHGKDETIDQSSIRHYDDEYHEEDDDFELNLNRMQVQPKVNG
ncbi:MMPL family transporter [Hymenobacter sp. YC55]|uniref:efflux RND transporter permease subunit n=1 Tax=Hymenobacter sp. YC55 TaxID=3034019 RepID=UPI0023F654C1|nr:MMPL family transporter [Hymenobacter sp. YC55]MDF7812438.1 MMPL family transporter [Hymenobacter sp. YC55]